MKDTDNDTQSSFIALMCHKAISSTSIFQVKKLKQLDQFTAQSHTLHLSADFLISRLGSFIKTNLENYFVHTYPRYPIPHEKTKLYLNTKYCAARFFLINRKR